MKSGFCKRHRWRALGALILALWLPISGGIAAAGDTTSDPTDKIERQLTQVKANESAEQSQVDQDDPGFLEPGESFKETFSVPGIYRYTCAVHEAKGMNGEVVVQK